ncbi:hypothetical protein ISG33_11840 [Glaciecola sp. MH2013]|uniref:hypothetical protein n=1 Tax=Glaciecola sp. MH2013 TaxID=2785524 RepID=UPI00189EAA06|nr:hypothetical protein [Glaciecola sp. MH2013]MBF7074091.1 hypothetical protein [Glaciecola sp. MH2013]
MKNKLLVIAVFIFTGLVIALLNYNNEPSAISVSDFEHESPKNEIIIENHERNISNKLDSSLAIGDIQSSVSNDIVESLSPEQLEMVHEFLKLLEEDDTSDWVQFVKNADEKAVFHHGSYALSLLGAINKDAPEEVLYTLLSRGVDLAPSHAHQLVARGDIELLEKFENFGLNIYEENPVTGKNALFMAMADPRETEMFDYLLSREVPTNTSADMLGYAMLMAKDFKQADYFVEQLVKNGAPMTIESHNWLLGLKESNLAEYLRIARILNKHRQ